VAYLAKLSSRTPELGSLGLRVLCPVPEVEVPVPEVGGSKVDAKLWQIAKAGKVWGLEQE
jgi:hypothetical protein